MYYSRRELMIFTQMTWLVDLSTAVWTTSRTSQPKEELVKKLQMHTSITITNTTYFIGMSVVPPRIGYIRETTGSSSAALRQQQLQARKGQLRLSQLNSPTAAASESGTNSHRHLAANEQRNSLTFEVHSLSPPQILVGGQYFVRRAEGFKQKYNWPICTFRFFAFKSTKKKA